MEKPTKYIVLFVLFCAVLQDSDANILDYLGSNIRSYFTSSQSEKSNVETVVFDKIIPYEVSVTDEKFINQAIELSGSVASELDKCQHRVILKLRNNCQTMNDEDISKVSVHFLNCQSYVEGRQLYPCSDQMSIRECTSNMDADAWNSYHLMSNRVRAVCFSIRQVQFRGLTEQTVNKLLDAAMKQIQSLGKIVEDQEQLKSIAEVMLDSVSEGHAELAQQQRDMQQAQLYGQMSIEDNIKRLSYEKELIISSHQQLADMARNMQDSLEHTALRIKDQAVETSENHKELLGDLNNIQERAKLIFQRIEESSDLLVKQSEMTQNHYDDLIKQLNDMNSTVSTLVVLVSGTKKALEEQLSWLTASLGGTDDAIDKIYTILWHFLFIVLAMVVCAFLSVNTITRIFVITVVPLNLLMTLNKFEHAMGVNLLGMVVGAYITVQIFVTSLLSLVKSKKTKKPEAIDATRKEEDHTDFYEKSYHHAASSERELSPDAAAMDFEFESPTPPMSTNEYYSTRSRSPTPLLINLTNNKCSAFTRHGTPCRRAATVGRTYCHTHQNGSSVRL